MTRVTHHQTTRLVGSRTGGNASLLCAARKPRLSVWVASTVSSRLKDWTMLRSARARCGMISRPSIFGSCPTCVPPCVRKGNLTPPLPSHVPQKKECSGLSPPRQKPCPQHRSIAVFFFLLLTRYFSQPPAAARHGLAGGKRSLQSENTKKGRFKPNPEEAHRFCPATLCC